MRGQVIHRQGADHPCKCLIRTGRVDSSQLAPGSSPAVERLREVTNRPTAIGPRPVRGGCKRHSQLQQVRPRRQLSRLNVDAQFP